MVKARSDTSVFCVLEYHQTLVKLTIAWPLHIRHHITASGCSQQVTLINYLRRSIWPSALNGLSSHHIHSKLFPTSQDVEMHAKIELTGSRDLGHVSFSYDQNCLPNACLLPLRRYWELYKIYCITKLIYTDECEEQRGRRTDRPGCAANCRGASRMWAGGGWAANRSLLYMKYDSAPCWAGNGTPAWTHRDYTPILNPVLQTTAFRLSRTTRFHLIRFNSSIKINACTMYSNSQMYTANFYDTHICFLFCMWCFSAQ